jgi:cyclic beta-1,2-glucan synthetase
LETLLGLHKRGNRLRIDPRIPGNWPGFTITWRQGAATYRITVENAQAVEAGVVRVELDGQQVADGEIELSDDGRAHQVRVVLGPGAG